MSLRLHGPASFPKLHAPPHSFCTSLRVRFHPGFELRSTKQDWIRETEMQLERTSQEQELSKVKESGQLASAEQKRDKSMDKELATSEVSVGRTTVMTKGQSTANFSAGIHTSINLRPPFKPTQDKSYRLRMPVQSGRSLTPVKTLNGVPHMAVNHNGVPVYDNRNGLSSYDDANFVSGGNQCDNIYLNQTVALKMPEIMEAAVEKPKDIGKTARTGQGIIQTSKTILNNGQRTSMIDTNMPVSEVDGKSRPTPKSQATQAKAKAKELKEPTKNHKLVCSMDDVLVVDDLYTAKTVVCLLKGRYRHLVHACDTEVADIDVRKESPVGHGKVICFSIYCGVQADFGNGKSCIWVDVLAGDQELLHVFKDYFEDSSIRKVWHNFSFDRHALANHGVNATGFYADTMHLARLWDSGRKGDGGGYSLESLTSDANVMNSVSTKRTIKKISMKDLFGVPNIRKDGTEGKLRVVPPVEEIQVTESLREKWVCYSTGDAVCTWLLWESLREKLKARMWTSQSHESGDMYDFYGTYWRPFGELLVEMEAEGMLVDQTYLNEIEKVAYEERLMSINRFCKWAARYCPDAQHINVTSDTQIRQLLFGGFYNIEKCRKFSTPNTDGYIEEGMKVPKKQRTFEICGIGVQLPCEKFTEKGLPAVSMIALKSLAGNISADLFEPEVEDPDDFIPDDSDETTMPTSAGFENKKLAAGHNVEDELSVYGTAYHAFGGGDDGKDACKAVAALCEVATIDTLLSSFIKPLQEGDILGPDKRVHCSLNLNTETGRLSARRPNLQNQPALEKDRYKIRQAFIAGPGKSLIVADYGQLELRILAHLANCQSMLEAFKIGGDFHSRTAMNMYDHVKKAVNNGQVILEWEPHPGEICPPCPLLKDVFGAERRKAKMLNFSIAYGKTARGLAQDWKVSHSEAQATVDLWYQDRPEVRQWQEQQKAAAWEKQCVYTLLGRARHFPDVKYVNAYMKGHIFRAAINAPVQGSAADIAMLAMLEIAANMELRNLGWKLLLQVHDEVILEGPTENADRAKELVIQAMSHPFRGKNLLSVELAVDAKCAKSWYGAK